MRQRDYPDNVGEYRHFSGEAHQIRNVMLTLSAVYPEFIWVTAAFPYNNNASRDWVVYPLSTKGRDMSERIPGSRPTLPMHPVTQEMCQIMFYVFPDGSFHKLNQATSTLGIEGYYEEVMRRQKAREARSVVRGVPLLNAT